MISVSISRLRRITELLIDLDARDAKAMIEHQKLRQRQDEIIRDRLAPDRNIDRQLAESGKRIDRIATKAAHLREFLKVLGLDEL